jgi:hypothetical protein
MSQKTFGLIAGLAVFLIAGCGSNTPTANTSPQSNTASSPTAAASPSAQASAVATTTDPCQLVTSAEASSLTGVTYTAGTQDNQSPGVCWYGAQTLNVFEVVFAKANSSAEANAQWSQYEAKVQSTLKQAFQQVPGLTLSFNVSDISVTGFDRAATGTFSATYHGQTISASALYTLKGADFFAMSDLAGNQAVPNAAALEAQAQTTSGRLP